MKAKRLDNGEIYELTGSCFFRDEEGYLMIAVSYEIDGITNTNSFTVDEETGKIIHPGFELLD